MKPLENTRKPLEGKRILVTRSQAPAAELCDKLAAQGATPILFPTIELAPLEDTLELDRAILNLARYDWIIFTSVNGVKVFWARLEISAASLAPAQRIAAIGPATARELERHNAPVNLIPEEYVAEAIVENIGDVAGRRILLPRADIARQTLATGLRQRGARVDEIAVYRILPAALDRVALAELRRGVEVITFTSSSTARNFERLAGRETGSAIIACIGPVTAQTVRELGLPVDVIAAEYTLDGLLNALVAYFEKAPQLNPTVR